MLSERDTLVRVGCWSPELSKAISQTENYLAYAEQSGVLLKEDVRKRRGFDVRVLGPRGFIIAGTRKQLSNERMQNNFRLLNNSLANVKIVLYDDLLNSLKTFLASIKEGSWKKRPQIKKKRRNRKRD